jgi:hypothetical protein
MREQWWKTPSGDVVRIREAKPDDNGRPRVEMKWASGDIAYVWDKHAGLLLEAGAVPCNPVPGMLA